MVSRLLSEISIPINGWSRENHPWQLEKKLLEMPGVIHVTVNPQTQLAKVVFDAYLVDSIDFHQAVSDAGFNLPIDEVTLNVEGMYCMSCAVHVQGALEDIPGVLEASVNLVQTCVQVRFIAESVSLSKMEEAVFNAGYRAFSYRSEIGFAKQEGNSVNRAGECQPKTGRGGLFNKLFPRRQHD